MYPLTKIRSESFTKVGNSTGAGCPGARALLAIIAMTHEPASLPFGAMSLFRVPLTAVDPRDSSKAAPSIPALVDTGAELSWLPAPILAECGIVPIRKRSFQTATGQIVLRDVGYAILRAEGFETIDEIVFGEHGDLSILGVRTLEGFGAAVDPVSHRLIACGTIVAAA
jgi:predicted aspartyl protease